MRFTHSLSIERALSLLRLLLAINVVLVATLLPTTALAAEASLPTGTWAINANGYAGNLEITFVDTWGALSGTLYGVPITGFWDGYARRISFETNKASVDIQVYEGFLSRTQAGLPVLDGTFEAFSGSGAKATRSVYAWRADGAKTKPVTKGVDVSVYHDSAPFPSTFNVYANGQTGTLVLGYDAEGGVTGTLFGKQVQGFWDSFQRKLTFVVYNSYLDVTLNQVYTGYLTGVSTCRWDETCRLAGTFEAFSGSGGLPQRNVFGWYAHSAKSR